MIRRCLFTLALLSGLTFPSGLALDCRLEAANWYVAVQGKGTNAGTEAAPWDITSALAGGQKIEPGDSVWLRAGTYHAPPKIGGMGYEVRMAGSDGAPI